MDNGLICRWMTGQAKISPKISSYYAKPSNQKKLAETIQRNLLPLMADCNMVIQDIYTLFMQDDTISDTKNRDLHLYISLSIQDCCFWQKCFLLVWNVNLSNVIQKTKN